MSFRVDKHVVELSRRIRVSPGDTLAFVEDWDFLREFGSECGLTDDDLEALQTVITVMPTSGDIVPVTTTIRDIIYVKCDEATSYTECSIIRYAYLQPPANTVLLLSAYPGESSLPVTQDGAKIADAYVAGQFAYFSTKHTR